jgi:hypothetical protein
MGMGTEESNRSEASSGSAEEDWRLQAELDVADAPRALHDLVGHFRGPNVVREIEASVPHDVVITHDGRLLFAYAADVHVLNTARIAIQDVLDRDHIKASVRVSRWDDELDEWRQTDPPPSAQEQRARDAADRDAEAIQTRTLVVSSGKMIRVEFEQSMLEWAGELGLECKIIEHSHLLTTQLGFTVTGPKRKLDEFSQGLAAEEAATIRAERAVMLSPL